MRSTVFLCVRVCAREMANSTGFKTLKKHLCKIRRMRLKYYIEKEESEKISSSSSSNNIQQLSFTLSFYWNYYVSSKIVIRDYGFNWKFCRVGKTMKNSLEFKMRMEKKVHTNLLCKCIAIERRASAAAASAATSVEKRIGTKLILVWITCSAQFPIGK